ncbi:EexN family lipoprotein [Vibrio natriegens]|uniref:EexN family lipoprotein n=1 Tax=Vibrio natriegens TaxID=691 RepID=UPI0022851998|nr:EexN family lipoprotein [Vibrio natriegens]MCY9876978.1 EexN family lipoprotein [Vibrio natriegens]
MKRLLSLLFISATLVGCGNETKTIEYYSQHLEEANNVHSECEKSSATPSENCKNARKALLDNSFDQFTNGDGISY